MTGSLKEEIIGKTTEVFDSSGLVTALPNNFHEKLGMILLSWRYLFCYSHFRNSVVIIT